MKLYSLLGNRQKLDGGAMFGNAPKAFWRRLLPSDDNNRIELACRCLLVEEASGRRILFETGIGSFFSPEMKERFGVQEEEHILLKRLAELGLSDSDIDIVVLSHLHFDHAGGLLSGWREGEESELLFPKASFLVGKEAWERALAPHPRDRASFIPRIQELLEASGRLDLVIGPQSSRLGEAYRFHLSHGHTPGQLLCEMATPDGPLVYAGDLVPGIAWVRKGITMGYDRFPELLIDEKAALLRDLIERGGRLFFSHDPQYAVAGLEQNAQGQIVAKDPVPALATG
ncbi:MAG: MBL fold hydrolase [Planctomycetota bacterium]|nr:MAG: MBL fold hydrolase [Planctomycetota bacterium]